MTKEDRKTLRDEYAAEYQRLTGYQLVCIERTGVRPNRAKVACRMHIVRVAGEYAGIDPKVIKSKTRKSEVAEIRRMIVIVMKEHKIIHDEIAAVVGYSDHSVVTYMVTQHNNLMLTDPEYNSNFKKFREYCREQIHELHEEQQATKVRITKATISGIKKMLKANSQEEYKRVAEVYGIHPETVQKIANNTYKSKRLQEI